VTAGEEVAREEKTEAAVQTVRAKPAAERKRPQPAPSPKATPPPKAKRSPNPTRTQTTARKRSEETPTPLTPRRAKVYDGFKDSMREYALSQSVRAGGGTLKSEADESQFRIKSLREEEEFTQFWDYDGHETCRLTLEKWDEHRIEFLCDKCNEKKTRPLMGYAGSYGFWCCPEHYLFVCLTCTPVEIKTILKET
jgi:hypothetical protein